MGNLRKILSNSIPPKKYAFDNVVMEVVDGILENKKFKGKGTITITYPDGSVHVESGEFEKGQLNGLGKRSLAEANGTIRTQEGNFRDGGLEGQGKYTLDYPSGDKVLIEGNFLKGKIDGQGTLTHFYINGGRTIAEGNFPNGKLEGQGKLTQFYANGGKTILEGNFLNGQLDGHGKTTEHFLDGSTNTKVGFFQNDTFVSGTMKGSGETYEHLTDGIFESENMIWGTSKHTFSPELELKDNVLNIKDGVPTARSAVHILLNLANSPSTIFTYNAKRFMLQILTIQMEKQTKHHDIFQSMYRAFENEVNISSSSDTDETIEKTLSKQKNEPVVISGGWQEHAIEVVVHKNRVFVCNRGDGQDKQGRQTVGYLFKNDADLKAYLEGITKTGLTREEGIEAYFDPPRGIEIDISPLNKGSSRSQRGGTCSVSARLEAALILFALFMDESLKTMAESKQDHKEAMGSRVLLHDYLLRYFETKYKGDASYDPLNDKLFEIKATPYFQGEKAYAKQNKVHVAVQKAWQSFCSRFDDGPMTAHIVSDDGPMTAHIVSEDGSLNPAFEKYLENRAENK